VLTYLVHTGLGWHTRVVAASPLLLFLAALAVVAAAEIVHRNDGSVEQLVVVEGGLAVVGLALTPTLVPGFVEALTSGVGFLVGKSGILETRWLFADSLGGVVGPLLQFGFLLVIALPYMVWMAVRVYRGSDPTWLVPLSYGWLLLPLAVMQIRFAAELALVASVFGGLGFVHLAAWVDLTAPPEPLRGRVAEPDVPTLDEDRRQVLRLAGLSLGVGGAGALLTPLLHGQMTNDRVHYQVATFLRDYAVEHAIAYPDNYVFSEWGENRLYNWFVSGESRSYRYAQENFVRFLRSLEPATWYRRLADRAGFVVVSPVSVTEPPEDSIYSRLVVEWGDQTGHYRAL
jgi:hypothetical protein